MRPIATDGVAWSVCLSVCLSVTTVSPAKAAELTDRDAVPDVDYRVDPRNHVLDWGPDLPMRRTILRGDDVGISPHAVEQRSDWLHGRRSSRV